MADNLVLNAGSGGSTLATDDIGGVHYQIVKISYGALDTATPVDGTNRLPTSAAQSGTWTVTGAGGTFPVTDSAGSLTVDAPVATPVFVRLSDGAAAITALPVTDNAGSLTVDGTVAVSSVGGTVAVTQSSAWSLSANQSVNVAQLAGTTTDTNSGVKSAGTLRVVLATDQPQLTNKLLVTPDSVALPANQSVNVSQINGVTPLMGNGVTGTGSQRVTIASDNAAFTVNAAQSGTWTVQPGNTANTTAWLVNDQPATSGGLSFSAVPVSAASNNKTQAKASAGQLYSISAQNISASVRYLKIFNNTSAGVTMGTTACDFQFIIPSNSTTGAGVVFNIDKGIAMGTGITYAITGGISATDNTSIGASEVSVLIGYK